MRLIVYLDLLVLVNLIMNYILLWATAKLINQSYKIWRLLIAALIGTIYTIIVILAIFTDFNQIISHLIISVLMLLISFAPITLKSLLKSMAYLYLITFITAGAIFALYNLTGSTPLDSLAYLFNVSADKVWIIILGALFIMLVAKFGWVLLQQKMLPEIFSLPTIIKLGEKRVKFKALVDTGNQLRDPLTRAPVIVVELNAVKDLFPKPVKELFLNCSEQEKILTKIIDTELADRFRLIPFSSLGKDNGMLVGFRPDMVIVKNKQEIFMVERVVIALKMDSLDLEDDYQALLNPAMFTKLVN